MPKTVYSTVAATCLYGVTMFLFFSGWIYAFLIIPVLSGTMYYCIFPIVKRWYQTGGKKKNIVQAVMEKLGDYSYELMFMHIYPASYGTRIARVILERAGIQLSGTMLFLVLLIPWFVCSFFMAVVFRKVILGISKIINNNR